MFTTIVSYLGVGAVAGLLAGLFGVGGGLVIVPMLVYLMAWQGLPPDSIMKIALGTSLATIVFTSISSFYAHHRRGAVQWPIVRGLAPGIVAGTMLGSSVAANLPTAALKIVFVAFVAFTVYRLLWSSKPGTTRPLPGLYGMLGVGGTIGTVSSLVGIGGGSLSVPFMLWCGVPAHRAIGTSAAIGFPIAISGALGYMLNGWRAENLPHYSLGYVYLPALMGIAVASVLTAPLGVRLAHSLPVPKLKRAFAGLMLVIAAKILWDLCAGK